MNANAHVAIQPTHMLPFRRNATPPNIFFSTRPLRLQSEPRIRSANRSSKAMDGFEWSERAV